jgi:hypothetical protein
MLDRDKDRAIAIMDDRATSFGLVWHCEELHQMTALVALERYPEQAIDLRDGPGSPIGGDPQVSDRVERKVVRTRDGSDRAVPASEVSTRLVASPQIRNRSHENEVALARLSCSTISMT